MKIRLKFLIIAAGTVGLSLAGVFLIVPRIARANQADDTTIRIIGFTPGVTPFISNVHLTASNATVIKEIQFTIHPKAGSVTRPLSATYANYYLIDRGFENQQTGDITLPVYGLYDGFANVVTLTYRFVDGSSRQANLTIGTAIYDDTCGYKSPIVVQPRTHSTDLSYDYIFISSGGCGNNAPVIIDTDGALRWVAPSIIPNALMASSLLIHNAVYETHDSTLSRADLDGATTPVADYSSHGVVNFHHNIDPGKTGMLLEADTTTYYESVIMEVDFSGALLKTWNLADIISAAMRAGGDDPTQFVYSTPTDWFHNNAAYYNPADDSLIVSSRENFVIALDYNTSAIKWILGDPTKKWYQFPSLRQFALTLAPGSLPPIGEHGVSVTHDLHLLLFDNGFPSGFQHPIGASRSYSSPRKYQINLNTKVATEVWNYENNQIVYSPICSSVYEDAPFNYLIDYAFAHSSFQTGQGFAELLGLDRSGNTIFWYKYGTQFCNTAYNSRIIHLENTKFPAVGPRVQNLSTRGMVSTGDNVLINGFIVSGHDSQTVVLRALGPTLRSFGLSGVLADPVLSLYTSSGTLVATNDNWQTDIGATFMAQNGLAPGDPAESATLQSNLAPGGYTVVVRGKNDTEGISLAEVYEVYAPGLSSKLMNVSGRGFVGTGDNAVISGFIVGDVGGATVVVRALGPSLGSFGVSQPLSDPILTIYDANGLVITTNDNWQDDVNAAHVQRNQLAPPNALESAIILRLPAGAYTAVVNGVSGATGNALVEVYHLD
ncbi:MAG: aryl-sulfate sulfotransferase [Chthoniobacterales bacterium]